MHKEWKYSCGVAIRCGALVVSVGGVPVLCSASCVNGVNCSSFSFVASPWIGPCARCWCTKAFQNM